MKRFFILVETLEEFRGTLRITRKCYYRKVIMRIMLYPKHFWVTHIFLIEEKAESFFFSIKIESNIFPSVSCCSHSSVG